LQSARPERVEPGLDESTINAAGVRISPARSAGFGGKVAMPMSEDARSAEAIHRKLRAITAVLADPATTEHERATAQALKTSLEKQLSEEATSDGTWTDIMFRLGRAVKEIKQPTSASSPKGDWTDYAFRLGRTLRRGLKK
jgi:hypothetical protein